MLKRESIQFQVCKNPDVKCSVVERSHRTIRDRLYKYFTYKNSYRYIDIRPKFVRAYNNTVHSTTGKAPSRVTDSDSSRYGRGWGAENVAFASRKPSFAWDNTCISARKR